MRMRWCGHHDSNGPRTKPKTKALMTYSAIGNSGVCQPKNNKLIGVRFSKAKKTTAAANATAIINTNKRLKLCIEPSACGQTRTRPMDNHGLDRVILDLV